MEAFRRELNLLRESVERNTQAIEELRKQVSENTQAIQELRQEIAALKKQVAENTQAIKELRQEMEELKKQVSENTQAIKELRQEMSALRKEVGELKGYVKEILHILQEASGLKTEEDLRAFLDAALYGFGLSVQRYTTRSGKDVDILIHNSKLKVIEIKRTAYDDDVKKLLKVAKEVEEEFPDKSMLKPLLVCNVDKIRSPKLRLSVDILEFSSIRRIPLSRKRIEKIQERLKESDLFKS